MGRQVCFFLLVLNFCLRLYSKFFFLQQRHNTFSMSNGSVTVGFGSSLYILSLPIHFPFPFFSLFIFLFYFLSLSLPTHLFVPVSLSLSLFSFPQSLTSVQPPSPPPTSTTPHYTSTLFTSTPLPIQYFQHQVLISPPQFNFVITDRCCRHINQPCNVWILGA